MTKYKAYQKLLEEFEELEKKHSLRKMNDKEFIAHIKVKICAAREKMKIWTQREK